MDTPSTKQVTRFATAKLRLVENNLEIQKAMLEVRIIKYIIHMIIVLTEENFVQVRKYFEIV